MASKTEYRDVTLRPRRPFPYTYERDYVHKITLRRINECIENIECSDLLGIRLTRLAIYSNSIYSSSHSYFL